MKISTCIKSSQILNAVYIGLENYIVGGNKFHIKNNRLSLSNAKLRHSSIKICGKGNLVEIFSGAYLNNCTITIYGNNNLIRIGKNVILNKTKLCIEDNGNVISVGDKTTIESDTEIATIEGKCVSIGEDCMISSNVRICTGDSHSLVNLNGMRINHSQDIIIGNHVWIGTRAVLNKGVEITNNCIVGACALLTGTFTKPYSVIAGVPATVIKSCVDWRRERL